MNSRLLGWRPLSLLTVALAILLLALGCQQGKKPPEGAKPGPGTAQLPQQMLDALHGKQPEGAQAPGAPMPPMAMPQGAPQGMGPGMMQGAPQGMPGGVPRVPGNIIVPEQVKKGWKAVVVQVVEAGGATKDYRIAINDQLIIPGSGLTLKVESFLPDFKMTPQGITSLSNEPKNPAARVVVVEGGKTIFKGWLFKLFPEAHPFQHPKYRLLLKDWVAA